MFQKPTTQQYDRLKELSREDRIAACRYNNALFSAYYFPHTKKYTFALFHMFFFDAFLRMLNGEIWELFLFGFRESAKTSLVKEFIIFCICYNLEEYIVWDSEDGKNSTRALFDIVVELQTNRRIIEDFGELYKTRRSMDEVTQKSVSDFITNPVKDAEGNLKHKGIRVEAHTTQESARGFLHGGARPGLVVLDDFENKKTMKSEARTQTIWDHIQELKGGMDSSASRTIYLGNYISQFANIQKLIDKALIEPDGMEVYIVPIMGFITRISKGIKELIGEKDALTWPEKYVKTNAEANAFIVANPGARPRVSAEKKKKDLWTTDTGDLDWECEMMQNPIDNSLAKFKREYFKYITLEEVLKKQVVCFVTVDPAVSEKDKSDDTGISITLTDEDNFWYSKVFKVRLNSLELVNFLFDLHEYLKSIGIPPRRIGVEKEKYYSAIYPFLKKEMHARNVFLPMFSIDIKGRGKEDRITNALQYRYESGAIYHIIGEMSIGKDEPQKGRRHIIIPMTMTDYETQAQRFPAGGHDDMLDAHAYEADIARYDAPESQEEIKAKDNPYNMDNFVDRVQRKARENRDVDNVLIEQDAYGSAYEKPLSDNYFSEIE